MIITHSQDDLSINIGYRFEWREGNLSAEIQLKCQQERCSWELQIAEPLGLVKSSLGSASHVVSVQIPIFCCESRNQPEMTRKPTIRVQTSKFEFHMPQKISLPFMYLFF